jgi:hypothetical protein
MTRDRLHTNILLILATRGTVQEKAQRIMKLVDQYEGRRLLEASGIKPVDKSHFVTLEQLL